MMDGAETSSVGNAPNYPGEIDNSVLDVPLNPILRGVGGFHHLFTKFYIMGLTENGITQ